MNILFLKHLEILKPRVGNEEVYYLIEYKLVYVVAWTFEAYFHRPLSQGHTSFFLRGGVK